jgi:hypothetical protein
VKWSKKTITGVMCQQCKLDGTIFNKVNEWFADKANAIDKYGSIENWDTSNVTDMSSLFTPQGDFISSFNDDISRWDVSNVERLDYMFIEAVSFNVDLNGWDVSQVTGMRGMFSGARVFDQELNSWDDKVEDWDAVDTAAIVLKSPLVGTNSPCWLLGKPCHVFELDVATTRVAVTEEEDITTVTIPSDKFVYRVGTYYRFPPLEFQVRNHAKGTNSTIIRFNLANAPGGFTLNTETGVIMGIFTLNDVDAPLPLTATLEAVDPFGRRAVVETFTMYVEDRARFFPKLGARQIGPPFYPLAASSAKTATNVAVGRSNTFRLAPPNILSVRNGTVLSHGTVDQITFTFQMQNGTTDMAHSTRMKPNHVAMKPSGEVIGYFDEYDIGDCVVTITAIDAGGDDFTLDPIWLEVRKADVDIPTFGPNGQDCANGVRIDGTDDERFDGHYTCDCENTPYLGDNCTDSSRLSIGAVIGGLFGGFLALAVAGVAVVKHRERMLLMKAFDFEAELLQLHANGVIPTVAADSDDAISGGTARGIPREIKRRFINRTDQIGSGAFGDVYKAILDESQANGIPGYMVACKSVTTSTGDGVDDLKFEAAVMAQVGSHENLVSLIGVVTSGLPLLLVVSFCEHGSLLAVLRAHAGNGEPLELKAKLKLAHETARGMVYLCSRHFIHRDLAARNVLVASGMVAKVADFGLSRSSAVDGGSDGGTEYYRSKHGVFPVRWTAPEAMEQSVFSQASDVWSFGIVMVEMLQDGVAPYGVWTTQYVMSKVIGGYKHEKPLRCPDRLYAMMLGCWVADPNERPLFSRLVALLESFIFKDVHADVRVAGDSANSGGGYLDVVSSAADRPYPGQFPSITAEVDRYEASTNSNASSQQQRFGLGVDDYVEGRLDAGESVEGRLDVDGYVDDRSTTRLDVGDVHAHRLSKLRDVGTVPVSLHPRPLAAAAATKATRSGISGRNQRKGSVYLGFGDGDDNDDNDGSTRL